MVPHFFTWLRRNALLSITLMFIMGVSGLIILLSGRESRSYHVSVANPTCEKSSGSSSVDCTCCHAVKMGMPSALLKSTINGKLILGSYYDANGYVYVLARARHDGSIPSITAGPSVINITYTTANVTWTTNENSTSWVDWGLDTGYGNHVGDGNYVTSHSVNLIGLINHNTYHYRLTSADALGNTLVTGDYTFTVNLPPPVPTVIDQPNWIAPSSPFNVTLTWNPVTDPDGGTVEYEVIIDDDPNFGSPNYTSSWMSGTSWAADVARGYYYYWKVRSRDAAHPEVNSAWSAPDVFYVLSAAPPPAPTLISPADGWADSTYDIVYPVTLSWNPVTAPDGDPVQYYVQMSQASDFSVPYADSGWISGTGWSLSVGAGAAYYWRVEARDSIHTDAQSNWSAVFTFNIYSLGGSCPLVYVWTGRGYTYQTDVQGGVLGMPQLPPDRVKLYKEVYVKLPLIKTDARGNYVIKLREAQREIDYIDQLKLLVVDHPAGVSVYDATAMNTNSFGYRTEPKIYTVKKPRVPLKAWDKNGNDILALVSRVDNRPAPASKTDIDYYTFDFGIIRNTAHAKLLIDGWTVFGLPRVTTLVQPRIELVDANGQWQEVKAIGVPAGDLKTVVVDLGGLFMNPHDQRIRLNTGRLRSAKFAVDRVTLDESAPAPVRSRLIAATSADLHHPGRPPFIPSNLSSRIRSHDTVLADVTEAYFYGAFTRYGNVTALLNQTDDKFVIMRHGDELTVTFPPPGPRPLNYQRTILLMADLYYKGGSTPTVDPLPFHGMSSYPYPSTESYPQDAEHQDYLANYNTRVYPRPLYLTQGSVAAIDSPATGIMLAWDYLKRKSQECLQKTLPYIETAGGGLEGSLVLAAAEWVPRHYSLNTDYVELKVRDKTIINSATYKITSPGALAWESDSWVTPASPGTLFADPQKTAISFIDTNHWTTSLVSGDNTYNYQMYRFQVGSSWLSNLGQLDVTWRGYGEPTPGYNVELYFWNFSNNTWEGLGSFNAPSDVTFVGYRRTFFDRTGRGVEQFCTACHQSNYHQYCIDCHGYDPVNPAAQAIPGMVCFWCHDHNGIKTYNFAEPPWNKDTMWSMDSGCDHCHGFFNWGVVGDYTPPSLISGPIITNLTDTSVTISWTTNEWATSLVNYGTTTAYGNGQIASNTYNYSTYYYDHSATITGLTLGTTYHYQLKSTDQIWNVFKSGDYVFTTLWAIPPTTPVLIDQPDTIYFGSTYTATLSWNLSTQPQGYPVEYQVVIDDDFSFGSPNYTSLWQSGTSWTVEVAAPADYYWRVQARAVEPTTGHTQASAWSLADSFFIMNASPPPPPTLIDQPDGGTYDNTFSVTLQWNPVTAPDGDLVEYYVQISRAADFSSIYTNSPSWGAATSWTLTVDTGYTYYWHVSARDAGHPSAASAWSTPDGFYVELWPKSSCPFVYVWDGEKYQYITDIQGEALGIPKTNPLYKYVSLYGPSYFVLNGLLPDGNNLYRVKLREVLAEVDYFDEAKLLLVDYPAGYEIVSSSVENTYYQGYVNPFKIYTLKDPRPPISATDQNGNDILDKVLAVDDNPAPPDIQAPEYYTFDFGPIAHPENAKLVLDGWSLYGPDAYKVVPNLPNIDPYVELINAQGQWQKVKTFGFISGDLKTMVVDLSGLFMSSDHRIRLNLGFYKPVRTIIDRVRLDDSASVELTVTELSAISADLHHGGNITARYSNLKHRIMALDDSLPDNEAWYMYGAFTCYGDVLPLLSADDDKMVFMRHGDELSLTFANTSPPLYDMERKALLKADVYYKSNKLSKLVDPLPYNGMTAYPPNPWLGPTSSDYQQYLEDYNTRVYEQPPQP